MTNVSNLKVAFTPGSTPTSGKKMEWIIFRNVE